MKKLIWVLLTICMTAVLLVGPALADRGTITPGENLVVEGIPSIPSSLVDEVGRYTEFRSAALVAHELSSLFHRNVPAEHLTVPKPATPLFSTGTSAAASSINTTVTILLMVTLLC